MSDKTRRPYPAPFIQWRRVDRADCNPHAPAGAMALDDGKGNRVYCVLEVWHDGCWLPAPIAE